jgi:hypothetical protein
MRTSILFAILITAALVACGTPTTAPSTPRAEETTRATAPPALTEAPTPPVAATATASPNPMTSPPAAQAVETIPVEPSATSPLPESPAPTPTVFVPRAEIAVLDLALAAPLDEAEAEISGMAWYGDLLVLMPQFPARYDGTVFGLDRGDILARLEAEAPAPLEPRAIAFDDGGLHASIEGFEGFEAITFFGERVFVTIEARRGATTMMG